MMRTVAVMAFGALAACTSSVTVPGEAVIYEVPPTGTASSYGGAPLYGTDITASPAAAASVAAGVSAPGAPVPSASGPITSVAYGSDGETIAVPQPGVVQYAAGTPLDDDRLNLNLYTLQQQRVDAAIAERDLAEARSQLVVVPAGGLPNQTQGPNIALYAQQSSNAVGQRIYNRGGLRISSACRRYPNDDDAQRAFLAAGGPQSDQIGLDGDGDGFACDWDPEPYRALR